MKVSVSVHGRFHAFELAAGLHRKGLLAKLVTTYPGFAVRWLTGMKLPVNAAWWLEAHRRFLGTRSDGQYVPAAFARFAAKNLPKDCDILVGWSSATLETIEPARALGMKVIIERGSSHIAHQTKILSHAYHEHGIEFTETPVGIIDREEAEYAAADAIAVPSIYAKRTFLEQGTPETKLIVNSYGVDLSWFRSVDSERNYGPIRILFVGRVGIRKGIPNLLEAFRPLVGKAELHLVGPVDPAFQKYLSRISTEGIYLRGAIPANELPAVYQSADIFCLTSLEEGFPLVLLQAMACGLPVIASPETGAEDVIRNGTDGFIVDSGNVEALSAQLMELVTDLDKRKAVGRAARARVESGWSWKDYVERALTRYETLLR